MTRIVNLVASLIGNELTLETSLHAWPTQSGLCNMKLYTGELLQFVPRKAIHVYDSYRGKSAKQRVLDELDHLIHDGRGKFPRSDRLLEISHLKIHNTQDGCNPVVYGLTEVVDTKCLASFENVIQAQKLRFDADSNLTKLHITRPTNHYQQNLPSRYQGFAIDITTCKPTIQPKTGKRQEITINAVYKSKSRPSSLGWD